MLGGISAKAWTVYSETIGNTKYLYLNTSASAATYNFWNNTSPTSSVFSLSSDTNVNSSSGTYIAYCWSSVTGHSKIGSYNGNGSASGPTISTGFEPSFVLIKRTDTNAARNWRTIDNKRSLTNPRDKEIYPNLINSEGTYNSLNFNSTNFQVVNTDASYNASNGTYLYMAIK